MHNVQEIAKDIYWIGGNDFALPRFEGVIPLAHGVAYNSYFIDDEKTAVIDSADTVIRDLFLDNISYLLHGRKLDYIVINHMEPDHSSSLRALSEKYPEAQIVASPAAQKMIGQYFHGKLSDKEYLSSDEKTEISLGKHVLSFIKAPMVHWPEVTFTYEKTERILFSADAFGTFGVLNGSVLASDTDYKGEYLFESRKYYANIVSRYGMQVNAVLNKVEKLPIRMVCSLHGPVLDTEELIHFMVGQYRNWASWTPDYEDSVNIFFSSPYGNTAMAAQKLAMLLGQGGIRNVKVMDLAAHGFMDCFAEVMRRKYMVLAAPTMNMGMNPMMQGFMNLCSEMELKNRKVSLIGNSSWAPNVSVSVMRETVSRWKTCELLGEPVSIVSSPSDEDEGISRLAEAIIGDIRKSEKNE